MEKKYDREVWLNQYNTDAIKPKRETRIRKLAKDLDINILTLTLYEKEEIGFYLYCDYLKGLLSEIEKGKQLIEDCEAFYVCHWRKGEVLFLFGNPKTKQELEVYYQKNLQVLKNKRNDLDIAKGTTEEINRCDKAIKDLMSLNNLLLDNWETKVNPLDPSIDDRKIKDMPLGNTLLKSLAKEEESTTQNLLNPAE